MRFRELRILSDENISPKVVAFLRSHRLDVTDTKEQRWQGRSDDELLEIAYREERWVLTHDSDFGTLAIREGKPCFGIIFLRLTSLKSDNVIRVCDRLLRRDDDLQPRTLVVVEEARIRIRPINME